MTLPLELLMIGETESLSNFYRVVQSPFVYIVLAAYLRLLL